MEEGTCKSCGTLIDFQGVDDSGLCLACFASDGLSQSVKKYKRGKLSWINSLSIGLGTARLIFYFAINPTSRDALWQFSFVPLWIIDFPVSVLYCVLPIPIGEAIIGPLWWYCLPKLGWWFFYEMGAKKLSMNKENG